VAAPDVNLKSVAKGDTEKPKRKPFRDWHGLLGGRLGYLWIGFDVISQFGMQFLLLTLAAIIAMAVPRYKGLAAATIFAIMISGYALWPHWVSAGPMNPDAIATGERQIQVASFNTLASNTNDAGVAASLIALDADVVTLMELGEGGKTQLFQALKQKYPYQADCKTVVYCELAIVSKFPLLNVMGDANWEGPAYIRATVQFTSGPITVLGVHTTRFPQSRAQFTQVKALVKLVETVTGRVIIMGDFNSTPFSRINHTMSEGLGFTRVTSLPTWPATVGFPQLAIDHIFVSPGIRAISNQHIGDNAGSDHFPISIILAVPNT
jgi:endonuclease/exonuclease/phosphatase (EEP) superfamily protein YafD